MKATHSLLIFFVLVPFMGFGQMAVNQYDSTGKKQGQWIEYLNSRFKVQKDSSGASYWAYNYYDHGENNYRISFGKEWKMNDSLFHSHASTDAYLSPGIQALDGLYKWYDNKRQLVSEDSFAGGVHLWSKVYEDGMLVARYDYTQTYLGNPMTYLIEIYEEDGVSTKYYWRNGVEGWKAYPTF